MATRKDTEDGITWNNTNIVLFCEVYIEYQTKNGRGQNTVWRDVEELFMEKVGKRHPHKKLKNKFDSMKRDWRLWKVLKTGETGLGWDPTTGKLDCSDEWWERKLKEKPEARKYRNKGLCPLVEEKWDQLFGDAVATGVGCVAPSANAEFVDITTNEVDEVEEETNDVEDVENEQSLADDAYRTYTHYDRLASLDQQEDVFWLNLRAEVSGNPPPTNTATKTVVPKTTKSMKRRRRESGGSVLMRQHIQKVNERHSKIMDLIKQGRDNKKDDVGPTIDQMMDIMNDMAANSDIEIGGDIWCHAMHMFQDSTNRELFYKMPSDDARLAWLKFSQSKNIL